MTDSSDLVRFWTWRDNIHQRLMSTHAEDEEHASAFVARANEIREEVEFLTRSGLTEGAVEALSAIAEQDMADFCILVDLCQEVDIAGVEKLSHETRLHLEEFLDEEPWHSLMVDTDLTVAIAMLEDLALREDNLPWYEVSPNLVRVTARVLDQANAEQVGRFAAELAALHERSGMDLPQDVADIVAFVIDAAAKRLGIAPPAFT